MVTKLHYLGAKNNFLDVAKPFFDFLSLYKFIFGSSDKNISLFTAILNQRIILKTGFCHHLFGYWYLVTRKLPEPKPTRLKYITLSKIFVTKRANWMIW